MAFIIESDDSALLHRQLAHLNLAPDAAVSAPPWRAQPDTEFAERGKEVHFLESLRIQVEPMLPACGGTTDDFVAWMTTLTHIGPGQQHPLFDWLGQEATLEQLLWFLTQQSATESGFDRMLDQIQPILPPVAAHEWFHVSRAVAAHGMVYGRLRQRILRECTLTAGAEDIVWEALATNNLLHGLQRSPRYSYHAIGAIGALELGVAQRLKHIATAIRRVGLRPLMRIARPSPLPTRPVARDGSSQQGWLHNVIRPLVDADPASARAIAEGALMRFWCNERCFDRYALALQAEQFDLPCSMPDRVAPHFSTRQAGECAVDG